MDMKKKINEHLIKKFKMKQCVVRLDRIPMSKIEVVCSSTVATDKKNVKENVSFVVQRNGERTFTVTIEPKKPAYHDSRTHVHGQPNQNQPKIPVRGEGTHEQKIKTDKKTIAELNFKIGDFVFVKVRGYAWWPAVVKDVSIPKIKVEFFCPEKSW